MSDAVGSSETPMVARVNFSRKGAGDLVRYIDRGDERGARDELGRSMDSEAKKRFIRRSEERGFTRSIVLSVPEHARENLDERAMSRATQRTMNEQLCDAPSARYVYGIHADTDNRHAHIAVCGNEHDLTWDRGDLNRLRERANQRFIRDQRTLERAFELSQDRQQQQEQSRDSDRGVDVGR